MKISKGKTWSVNALTMTQDGSKIVSVSGVADRAVVVRDAASGETIWNLKGHQGAVVCVAVSPDGTRIVSGSEDKTVRLWDLNLGKGIRTMEGHANTVNAVCVSPDGKWVVSGSKDTTCRVWDLETGRCVRVLEGHGLAVNCVSMSPDGERIVSGSDDRTVRVWDCDLKNLNKKGSTGPVGVGGDASGLLGESDAALKGHLGEEIKALVFSEDGRFVVSAGADLFVRVWDTETGKLLKSVEARTLNASSWDEAVKKVARTYVQELEMDQQKLQQQQQQQQQSASANDESDPVKSTPKVEIKKRPNSKMVMVIVNGKSKLMTQEEAELLESGNSKNLENTSSEDASAAVERPNSIASSISKASNDTNSHMDDKSQSDTDSHMSSFLSKLGNLQPSSDATSATSGWFLDEDGWVLDRKQGGNRRLWLPSSLRGQLVSFQGRIIVVGTNNGQIAILHV
jgi:hypothetical protein